METRPPAAEVRSPDHWTAREFPTSGFLVKPSKERIVPGTDQEDWWKNRFGEVQNQAFAFGPVKSVMPVRDASARVR